MKKLFYSLSLAALCLIFSSWGSTGHRIINQHAPASFPAILNFLKATWPTILSEHASDADYRKQDDPTEGPKHYIDVENFSTFIQHGTLPMSYDSALAMFGYYFLDNNGNLPWATVITVDTLKRCFQRHNFTKASLVAADLGHYVGDGHQPLHITQNYDGQETGQDGIHSRYETHMVGSYQNLLTYADDSAFLIPDVPGYVFSYIYEDHKYVDSVLIADQYATSIAGTTSGSEYYTELWNKTGNFTIQMMRNASYALSSLIYTAWVQAGSPLPWPDGIDENTRSTTRLIQNYPNPFRGITNIPVEVNKNNTMVTVTVMDAMGNVKETLLDRKMTTGLYEMEWDATGFPGGMYYVVMKADDSVQTMKVMVIR